MAHATLNYLPLNSRWPTSGKWSALCPAGASIARPGSCPLRSTCRLEPSHCRPRDCRAGPEKQTRPELQYHPGQNVRDTCPFMQTSGNIPLPSPLMQCRTTVRQPLSILATLYAHPPPPPPPLMQCNVYSATTAFHTSNIVCPPPPSSTTYAMQCVQCDNRFPY